MGRRFRTETPEDHDAAAQALATRVLAVSSDGLGGPFNMLLKSPETGARVMDLLDHFNGGQSRLDADCRRLVQLMIARAGSARYAWWAHAGKAIAKAELTEDQVAALNRRAKPAGMRPKMAAVYDYVAEWLDAPVTSDAALHRLKTEMDEPEIVDLIVLCGLYRLIGSLLNEGDIGLPEGAADRLLP